MVGEDNEDNEGVEMVASEGMRSGEDEPRMKSRDRSMGIPPKEGWEWDPDVLMTDAAEAAHNAAAKIWPKGVEGEENAEAGNGPMRGMCQRHWGASWVDKHKGAYSTGDHVKLFKEHLEVLKVIV